MFLYNLLAFVILILGAPFLLYHLKTRDRLSGYLPKAFGFDIPFLKKADIQKGGRILLHCVSVGETLAARPLVEMLLKDFPEMEIVLTTTTKTGQETAFRHFADKVSLITYFPLDLSFAISRFLKQIKPDMVIIFETELWPALLDKAKKYSIPVYLVNARLSASTARIYEKVSFFWKKRAEGIARIGAQSFEEEARYLQMGIPADKIEVTGNMKFDFIPEAVAESELEGFRHALGLTDKDFVIVLGSTHDPEENELMEVLIPLLERDSDIRIILALRHLQRVASVEQMLADKQILYSKRTSEKGFQKGVKLLILDTLGELAQVYRIAQIAVIGGTFTPIGGHNILEPAQVGCVPVFGPHMFKQKPMLELAKETGGAIGVQDSVEVAQVISDLKASSVKMEAQLSKAAIMARKNLGAADQTYQMILSTSYLGRRDDE